MQNTTISHNGTQNNLSGWAKLEYTDVQNIAEELDEIDKLGILLTTGSSWAVIETQKISQECVAIDGEAYQHTIVAKVACRGTNPEATFQKMMQSGLVVRLTDSNGRHYIAGCTEEPLRLTYSNNDTGNAAEGAIYTLTFSCISRTPLIAEA